MFPIYRRFIFRKAIKSRNFLVSFLQNWHKWVEEFTRRSITFETDRLPALAGLAKRLSHKALGSYLAGLWEFWIFEGLAWSKVRAEIWNGALWENDTETVSETEEYLAPSWSWVPARHRVNMVKQEFEKEHPWNSFYAPKLISAHILSDNDDPYMSVQKGSFLEIEGYCRTIRVFIDLFAQPLDWMEEIGFREVMSSHSARAARTHNWGNRIKFCRMERTLAGVWLDNMPEDYLPEACLVADWCESHQGTLLVVALGIDPAVQSVRGLLVSATSSANQEYERLGIVELGDYDAAMNGTHEPSLEAAYADHWNREKWVKQTLRLI